MDRQERWLTTLLLMGMTLLGSGCNGPSSDCAGTMKSFAGCINSNDWDCVAELISPANRKKFGDKMIRGWASDQYKGARSFEFTQMNVAVTGSLCIAQTLASFVIKVRGKQPEPFDDQYVSYTLHLVDGKWYMDIPGANKLEGY